MKTLKIGDLLARLPIIQGGMGVGISLSGLASAVANQGGVGVISSAGLGVIYREHSKDYNTASIWGLREELRKASEKTKGIIGVNVMVAMSNFADMVRTAIAEKADIIFSGAGMPLNLPSFLTKGSKTKLAPIVSSARAAKLICEKIAAALSEADPEGEAEYNAALESYCAELDELDAAFTDVVANGVRNTIVFGDRFPLLYFAKAYGLELSLIHI